MGYYVRVFCKSESKPNIKQVLEHINAQDLGINLFSNLNQEELLLNQWTNFELTYKKEKLPLLIECNNIGDDDGLAKDEINEFIEEIGNPGLLSINKRRVIKHLEATKYIVVSQLPTSDIDDDGYNANGEFLNYFVQNYGGMIHADREGFYQGTRIILKTD